MITQCLLDMDGVLADFVGGVVKAHGRPYPYIHPSSYGCFDIEKIWGISAHDFWSPCDGASFWDNLGKTPEADTLVNSVCEQFGPDNVAILTAPSQSPYCVPGKRRWIERYYPQLKKNIIFGSAKKFLAAPTRVLIDDRDKNVDDFVGAGGCAILMPRLWNREYDRAADSLDITLSKLKWHSSEE